MKLTQDTINVWIDSIAAPSTAKNYKARIAPLIRDSNDVLKEIKDMSLLTTIVERYESPSTLKGIVQVFLKLINEYPGIKVSDRTKKLWEDVFKEANSEMSQVYIQRSMEDTVESFSSVKAKVFEKYPEGSDERLYMELYELCPTRDDLGSIYIVPTLREVKKDKTKNYLVISRRRFVINEHKTANKHGEFVCKIPLKIWRKIDLTKEKLFDHGDTLSSWVGKMLKSVGVTGRINTLRHGFLSEKLKGDEVKDPKVRKKLARAMGHSGAVQLQYIREIER
jgi:hypothetical protein